MAYEEREMHKGDWTCAQCGGSITELPFQPDPARADQLKCRDCHRKGRDERSGNNGAQREMHKGDWACAKCGGSITELPFQPDPARIDQLKCRDCHRQEKSY